MCLSPNSYNYIHVPTLFRGLLDYEKPVCEYWPEFAANGKQSVKVGTLLSHGAGLLTITQRHELSLIRDDPEKRRSLLAQQKPLWKPGKLKNDNVYRK